MRIHTYLGGLALVLASALAAGPAIAATKHGASASRETPAVVPQLPNPAALAKMPEIQLKKSYLACDAKASREALSTIKAAHCAMMHRELVERVFGGDSNAFDTWWAANKSPASTGAKPLGAPEKATKPAEPVESPKPELNDKLHLPGQDSQSPMHVPDLVGLSNSNN